MKSIYRYLALFCSVHLLFTASIAYLNSSQSLNFVKIIGHPESILVVAEGPFNMHQRILSFSNLQELEVFLNQHQLRLPTQSAALNPLKNPLSVSILKSWEGKEFHRISWNQNGSIQQAFAPDKESADLILSYIKMNLFEVSSLGVGIKLLPTNGLYAAGSNY